VCVLWWHLLKFGYSICSKILKLLLKVEYLYVHRYSQRSLLLLPLSLETRDSQALKSRTLNERNGLIACWKCIAKLHRHRAPFCQSKQQQNQGILERTLHGSNRAHPASRDTDRPLFLILFWEFNALFDLCIMNSLVRQRKCFPPEQSASMLAAHYKIFWLPKLTVPLVWCSGCMCRHHLAFFMSFCRNWSPRTHRECNTLATALHNKVFDGGIACPLLASIKP
jgi:hypothetical protein